MTVIDMRNEAPGTDLRETAERLAAEFSERAARHDAEGSFVRENFERLANEGALGLMVPAELGGGGHSHAAVADFLRILAHGCPSTALSLSMHQHLVAATRWRWSHGKGGDPLLSRVARERVSLLSTGASDWLDSNGELTPAEGGFRLTARKPFCSGAPFAGILVTSARLTEPDGSTTVLHFGVPASSEGVSILDDWDTLGMRGTGSNTIAFDDVFVPEAAISLRRPAGIFHPFWGVVLTVAMPLIMAVYLGVAEAARNHAIDKLRRRNGGELEWLLAGELESSLTTCRLAVEEMIRLANDGDFEPTNEAVSTTLICKTTAAETAIATVRKAVEVVGGIAFYRRDLLERLQRDVQAAQFHPLQDKPQKRFTGRVALGLDPV